MPTVTPPSGQRSLYPKSDGWYEKNSSGVESKVGPAAAPLETILGVNGTIVTLGPTQVTTEVVMKTISVPAFTLGLNSHLQISALCGSIGTGSTCTWWIQIGGLLGASVITWAVPTSGGNELIHSFGAYMNNKNNCAIQEGLSERKYNGGLTIAQINGTWDFTSAQNIVLTAKPGGGSNITANAYLFFAVYVP